MALFVSADGSKVGESIVIWRSQKPHCFKRLKEVSHPINVHYFSNKKTWMTTELLEEVLKNVDDQMIRQIRNVLLFLDNAPCHPDSLREDLINVALKILLKNICFPDYRRS